MVRPGDHCDEPVIVKTDLNFAGTPERKRIKRPVDKIVHHPLKYPIYPNLDAVPSFYRSNPDFIIERFLPEIDGGYCVRSYRFMGDSWLLSAHKSKSSNCELENASD